MPGNESVQVFAVCVVEKDGRLLLEEYGGPDDPRYRLFGGKVHFNEPEQQAARRVFREELGVELTRMEFIGQMEDPSPEGNAGHHIFWIFKGDLADPSFYGREGTVPRGAGKARGKAVWKPLADLQQSKAALSPDGLLDLLDL